MSTDQKAPEFPTDINIKAWIDSLVDIHNTDEEDLKPGFGKNHAELVNALFGPVPDTILGGLAFDLCCAITYRDAGAGIVVTSKAYEQAKSALTSQMLHQLAHHILAHEEDDDGDIQE